ncbi:MAG: hypothetical protein Ct9H90mP6_11590 [Gammaproteobacteria bacterium]|nr:MAG: hypothetical protein Ct9H90mP6_11590 [Gammaproteobacteria bacterium]
MLCLGYSYFKDKKQLNKISKGVFMSDSSEYIPPKVWKWDKESGVDLLTSIDQ